ncbi:oligosaccharide flippase family protein [Metabacillus litoralis]|uniref:Oligosaccharide flippase family protein n=1 Tax=Metabacillus litoralis TaxID=152268 RepID=A0A5C6VA73_9BACI|nr:oligosaccharide flippase family protein [Metabacillus litoralis]TXC82187.1 oligosaccharide flippase family protein [Metabacillus litoralis]
MINKIFKRYTAFPPAVKAAIWFTIASFFQKGISFITVPIFTRLLSVEQYGQVVVFQSWLSIITIFATLSLWAGVFNNGMVKYENDRETFISALQGLSTTLTAVCLIIYLLFLDFWNSIFGLPTFLVLVMFTQLIVAPALSYWSAKQRFDYQYKKLIIITLAMSIASPLFGVFAVLATEDKGVARILSVALVQIGVCSVFYIYNATKGKQFFHRNYWKYALGFNLPLIPHYLSGVVLNQSDKIMIDQFSGTDKAGIYSVAYSAAMLLTILITSVNSSFTPWTYKKLKNKCYSEIEDISKFLLALIGGLILILVAFAPEIVGVLAPVEYYEAIWVIPPIAVSVFFIFLYSMFANIEFYFEENKFIMVASIIGAGLNILLNFFLIPIFGYIAAGFTTLFCYIVFSFSHYIFMRKVCKKHINGEKIYNFGFIVVFSLGMILTSMLLMTVYSYVVIRYLVILIIFLTAVICRKHIGSKIKQIREK